MTPLLLEICVVEELDVTKDECGSRAFGSDLGDFEEIQTGANSGATTRTLFANKLCNGFENQRLDLKFV